jgi:hypothetical protein
MRSSLKNRAKGTEVRPGRRGKFCINDFVAGKLLNDAIERAAAALRPLWEAGTFAGPQRMRAGRLNRT